MDFFLGVQLHYAINHKNLQRYNGYETDTIKPADCLSRPPTHESSYFYHPRTSQQLFLQLFSHHWHFDVPCRKWSRQRYFAKTTVDCLPGSISFGKFSPRCTYSGKPQYSIHCTAVITFCRMSAFPFLWVLWRQHIFDSVPLTFCELVSFFSYMLSLHNFSRLCKFYFPNKPQKEIFLFSLFRFFS